MAMQLTMRCVGFSGERARDNRLTVDPDGTVRVFDAVARHYTLHHGLADTDAARARDLAARAQAAGDARCGECGDPVPAGLGRYAETSRGLVAYCRCCGE